jgi:hypothetical protein
MLIIFLSLMSFLFGFQGGRNRVCYLDNETSFKTGTMRSTGDFGYVKDGQIWYCGRKDRQIKRQGKRTSLDWLEQTISKAFPDFVFCAVTDTCLIGRQQKIYLFVKPTSTYDERLIVTSLNKAFHEILPLYAHPDYVRVVNTMPMTSHGKVDTRALLRSCREEKSLNENEPVQMILARMWQMGITKIEDGSTRTSFSKDNCLIDKGSLSNRTSSAADEFGEGYVRPTNTTKEPAPCVDSKDMFVDRGGTSIDALRVANEIEAWLFKAVGSQVKVSQLLDVVLNSSFGTLCEYVEKKVSGKNPDDETTIMNASNKEVEQKVEKHGRSEFDKAQQADSGNGKITPTPLAFVHGVAGEGSSRLLIPNYFKSEKKSKPENKLDDDREMASSVSPKRRKIEGKKTLPIKAATDMTHCFCSLQRGMRATTSTTCMTSRMLTKVPSQVIYKTSDVHKEKIPEAGSFKAEISFRWKANFNKCIDASPLVVGTNNNELAIVYLGSHAHVFKAVQLSGGIVLWETRVGDRIESSAASSKCGLYVIVGEYQTN